MLVDENGKPFFTDPMREAMRSLLRSSSAADLLEHAKPSNLANLLNPYPVTKIAEEVTGKQFVRPSTITFRRYLPYDTDGITSGK